MEKDGLEEKLEVAKDKEYFFNIYNSLCLQGSKEKGGATALDEDDGDNMPSTNNDYYDEPYSNFNV